MKIPSMNEIAQMIHDMEMLDHIVRHSIQVSKVARVLTDQLRCSGIELDATLVEASALLHDITKTRSFKTKENHAQTGSEFLNALGFPAVGDIIRQHVVLDNYNASKPIQEADIVNYADKRVLHDTVVPLQDRKAYILEKYGTRPQYRENILRLWKKTESLQEKLFVHISFTPEELKGFVSGSTCCAAFINRIGLFKTL